jgi:hypothetical protein
MVAFRAVAQNSKFRNLLLAICWFGSATALAMKDVVRRGYEYVSALCTNQKRIHIFMVLFNIRFVKGGRPLSFE